jgi:hypothetical protein
MTQRTSTMAALTVAGLLAVLAPAFAAQNDTKGSPSQQVGADHGSHSGR